MGRSPDYSVKWTAAIGRSIFTRIVAAATNLKRQAGDSGDGLHIGDRGAPLTSRVPTLRNVSEQSRTPAGGRASR
jgi:hypothetical protein